MHRKVGILDGTLLAGGSLQSDGAQGGESTTFRADYDAGLPGGGGGGVLKPVRVVRQRETWGQWRARAGGLLKKNWLLKRAEWCSFCGCCGCTGWYI